MRLPWFPGARPNGQRLGRGRHKKSPTLRVRQLERRRVLDATAQSLVVGPTLETGHKSAVTTTVTAQQPLAFDWSTAEATSESAAAAAAFTTGQGGIEILAASTDPLVIAANDQSVLEGELLNLSGLGGAPPLGLILDPDVGDTHTAAVNWGDAPLTQFEMVTTFPSGPATAVSGTHTYAEGAGPFTDYTVTLRVADSTMSGDFVNGVEGVDFIEDTFIVRVHNVAPTVDLDALSPISENDSLALTGSYTDPGVQDAQTIVVAWDDPNDPQVSTFEVSAIHAADGSATLFVGDTFNSTTDEAVLTVTAIDVSNGKVTFTIEHQYLDDGLAPGNATATDTSTIFVSIMDDDGGMGDDTEMVDVQNVTPSVALGSVATITENGTATLTGSYTDIGLLDEHVLTVNWGDPNDAQLSTFAVTAIRDAAGAATLSVGQTFMSSTDEAVLTITAINSLTGEVSFSVQHQYLDDGPAPGNGTIDDTSTIFVDVMDDDGQTGSDMTSVIVENAAPTIVLNSVGMINENGTATLTGSFTDTGLLDEHVVTINWNDPNDIALSTFDVGAIRDAAGAATLAVGQMFLSSTDEAVLTITAINAATGQVSFSVQHQYLDDGLAPGNGTASDAHSIVVMVADDDAESITDKSSVQVHNVAPTVALGAVTAINENGTATLAGSYTDIGLLDAHTVTVDWGDPNDGEPSTFAVPAIRDAAGVPQFTVGQTFLSSTDEAVLMITGIDTVTGKVSFSVQHQYLDDGVAPGNATTSDTSTITVTVADDDGSENSSDTTVLVTNVAAIVALGSIASINENGTAIITGSYTDPGLLDAHTVTIQWGDPNDPQDSTFAVPAIRDATGNPTLSVGQTFLSSTDEAVLTVTAINAMSGQVSFSVEHQYLDDGLAPGNGTNSDLFTIIVSVADDDTDTDSATGSVLVNNESPTVSLGAVSAINENGTATLTGSYTDIGLLDEHFVTVNWGDPNDPQLSTFAVNAIRDAAGVLTLSVGQVFASSTDEATLSITAIDAITGKVSFSVQHQYLDDGLAPGNNTASDSHLITVTVTDDDTGSNSADTTLQVNNVAPSVALNSVSAINENGFATLAGNFTDIGLLDEHVLTVNWGDPNDAELSTFAINAIRNAAGAPTLTVGQTFNSSTDEAILTITAIDTMTGKVNFSIQHQYLDDGLADGENGANNTASDTSTITVTVADDDTASSMASTSVTVNNVSPTVVLGSVAAINENGTATLTGSYTDIGLLDRHVLTINWGDPNDSQPSTFTITAIRNAAGATTLTVGQTFNSSTDEAVLTITAIDAMTGKVSFSIQHQYLDDGPANGVSGANGTASDANTITVTVADDDTGSKSAMATVVVNNVAPTVALNGVSAIVEHGFATLTGSFTDIGRLDRHVLTVNWGDPNDPQISTFVVTAILNPAGTNLAVGQTFASTTDESTLEITGINASTGQVSFSVQHQYLDDGVADGVNGANNTANDTNTITVTVADDDTASNSTSTTVLVTNAAPTSLQANIPTIQENSTATLTTSFTDVGRLDRHVVTIDWDYLSDPNSTFTITAMRNAAGLATLTVGQTFNSSTDGAVLTITGIEVTTGEVTFTVQHAYGDDMPTGTASDNYNVSVTVADDDLGTNAVTTIVTVTNAAPTFNNFGLSDQDINESDVISISGDFTDRAIEFASEQFMAYVIWGDGHAEFVPLQVGADNRVLTQLSHDYADDGTYTVRIRVADDDMGAFSNTSLFTKNALGVDQGVLNVDFVETTLNVVVRNVAPTFIPVDGNDLNGDEIDREGFTQVRVSFQDIGYDNSANLYPFAGPEGPPGAPFADPLRESFYFVIDWSGGVVETIAVVDGNLVLSPDSTTEILSYTRTPGDANTPTTASLELRHLYLEPPNPANPAAPVPITVTVLDDNQGAIQATVEVANQGIQFIPTNIDTTPQVPRLEFIVPPPPQVLLDGGTTAVQTLQSGDYGGGGGDSAVTSERYLELIAFSPDNRIIGRYRLQEEALSDLRSLFARLPDGKYQIVLKRTDSDVERLVMEVYVRRGRVIDPSDDSEGTRDRPPTTEGEEQNAAVPLDQNPMLVPVDEADPEAGAAVLPTGSPAAAVELPFGEVLSAINDEADAFPPPQNYRSLRWGVTMAAMASVVAGGSWSRQVEAALGQADGQAWKRLRRAGRLGRAGRPSKRPRPAANTSSAQVQ